jgi:hypothetical protein
MTSSSTSSTVALPGLRSCLDPPTPPKPPDLAALPAPDTGASPDPADAPHTPGEAYPEVTTWLATLAPGTRGTAAELLPAFLAAGAPSLTRYGAPWSPGALGASLARLAGRHVAGRYLRRYRTRTGVALWEVVAVAVA